MIRYWSSLLVKLPSWPRTVVLNLYWPGGPLRWSVSLRRSPNFRWLTKTKIDRATHIQYITIGYWCTKWTMLQNSVKRIYPLKLVRQKSRWIAVIIHYNNFVLWENSKSSVRHDLRWTHETGSASGWCWVKLQLRTTGLEHVKIHTHCTLNEKLQKITYKVPAMKMNVWRIGRRRRCVRSWSGNLTSI